MFNMSVGSDDLTRILRKQYERPSVLVGRFTRNAVLRQAPVVPSRLTAQPMHFGRFSFDHSDRTGRVSNGPQHEAATKKSMCAIPASQRSESSCWNSHEQARWETAFRPRKGRLEEESRLYESGSRKMADTGQVSLYGLPID